MEDPRKEALKEGLYQLGPHELQRLIDHIQAGKPILLDRDEEGNANYSKGVYCPLAIAVGMDEYLFPYEITDDLVYDELTKEEYLTVYNTRGIEGEFYTTNRREDLLLAVQEVLEEKS